ncbi:SMI1/KNR4 family protein [Catellatospora citrea]|uniref:Knr4/Smi1-like domain-containing protein n=1 Tax=Catellatospora citrea TaxID=53366 RepID=A0A8J3NYA6_9ACTN|nr:SMI1/KNR4 family protein [Catellatospora citrea]RKE05776.1 cell wall assembly regulator SMI1 [Catellatospora citrea]GIF97137.1 hypothetical protein Cci01nite_22310 [Catellatospora citrea]
MDEIASIAHQLAAALSSGPAQTCSMHAVVTANGQQTQILDAAGRRVRLGMSHAVPSLLTRFRSRAGAAGAFCLELAVTGSGEYTATYSTDLPSLPPRVVLDESYRYPNDPAPGMDRPDAAVNDGRPTDPAVLAEVQALVDEFRREHLRLHGTAPVLPAGYAEEEILAAEARLGARLPEDLRALYRVVHDDLYESHLLGRFRLVPLESVLEWHNPHDAGFHGFGRTGLFEDDPVVFESHPHGRVRRLSRNDWWVTFALDIGMNFATVDLDPAPAGAYGQVLLYGRDVHGPAEYVAPSVGHLLRASVAYLRAARPGDVWDPDDHPTADHDWLVDVGDANLAYEVAAHPDAQAIQKVHLRKVDRVRLTHLAGFPHLRSIRALDVRGQAGHVDLSLTPGQPVEQIDVIAAHFEPRLLTSAPTIQYVKLGGNSEPVSIAALAGLPELLQLDLAAAEVTDVASITGFPALRVLILNARQWDELLATGWTPHKLAAVGLDGPTGVAQAVAWANTVQGPEQPARGIHTIRGRL